MDKKFLAFLKKHRPSSSSAAEPAVPPVPAEELLLVVLNIVFDKLMKAVVKELLSEVATTIGWTKGSFVSFEESLIKEYLTSLKGGYNQWLKDQAAAEDLFKGGYQLLGYLAYLGDEDTNYYNYFVNNLPKISS
jgi:hypothetical protein